LTFTHAAAALQNVFAEKAKCPYFEDKEYKILEAIMHSEMVYFVLPNYCDYPCANYFIFNERSQCFFQGRPDLLESYLNIPKRSIVISNTNQEHFIQALTYQSNREPEILFLSAKKIRKIQHQWGFADKQKRFGRHQAVCYQTIIRSIMVRKLGK
jgi:hypothetical protein